MGDSCKIGVVVSGSTASAISADATVGAGAASGISAWAIGSTDAGTSAASGAAAGASACAIGGAGAATTGDVGVFGGTGFPC